MSEFLISDWGLKGSAIVLGLIFFTLVIVFLFVPYTIEVQKQIDAEGDLVKGYNCDELKQFILEDIEDKNAHWVRNVDKAREYYQWKCHN